MSKKPNRFQPEEIAWTDVDADKRARQHELGRRRAEVKTAKQDRREMRDSLRRTLAGIGIAAVVGAGAQEVVKIPERVDKVDADKAAQIQPLARQIELQKQQNEALARAAQQDHQNLPTVSEYR